MNHMSHDQISHLLDGQLSKKQQLAAAEHVVDCDLCAQRYRAFRDLRQQMQPRPRRWLVGLASTAALAAAIMLTWNLQPTHSESIDPTIETTATLTQTTSEPTSEVLQLVKQVNFQQAVGTWGSNTSISELVTLRNRS